MSKFFITVGDIFLRLEAEGIPSPSQQWLSKLLAEDSRFTDGETYIRETSVGRPYLFSEEGYQLVKKIRIAGLETQKPKRIRGMNGDL